RHRVCDRLRRAAHPRRPGRRPAWAAAHVPGRSRRIYPRIAGRRPRPRPGAAHRLPADPGQRRRPGGTCRAVPHHHRVPGGPAAAALVFAVSQAGTTGPGSTSTLIPLGLSVLAAAAFTAAEHRHPDPLIRPSLLRPGGLRTAATLLLLLGLWNGGEMLVLSLYL